MNREEKSRDIKKMVIDVSRDLFVTNGYTVTTIRQITEMADINIGSLYHFFRDKEDILLHIVNDAYRDFMQAAKSIVGKEMNPVLQYSIVNALELKAVEKYDRIAELYLVVYNSWRITELMLSYNNQRNRLFFHKYNETFNDQDYNMRTLALRGIRLAFIAERVNKGILNFDTKCPFTIEMGLSLFNVPERTIKAAINKTMMIINEKSIMIYGFNI